MYLMGGFTYSNILDHLTSIATIAIHIFSPSLDCTQWANSLKKQSVGVYF